MHLYSVAQIRHQRQYCTLESCTYTDMTVVNDGAIVKVNNRDSLVDVGLRIYNSEFTSCASVSGGGIFNAGANTNCVMRGCYVHHNTGWLLSADTNSSVHVLQSEFGYNTSNATMQTQGATASGDPFLVDGCYIHNNEATYGIVTGYTGSLYSWRYFKIANSIFSGNTNYDVWMNGAVNGLSKVTIENCRFYDPCFIQTDASGTHKGLLTATNTYFVDLFLQAQTSTSSFTLNNCRMTVCRVEYDNTGYGMVYFNGCSGYIYYYTGAGANPPISWDGWNINSNSPTRVSYTGSVHHTADLTVGSTTDPRFTSSANSSVALEDTGPYPDVLEDETVGTGLCVIIENPLLLGQWRLVGGTAWHYTIEDGDLYVMTGLAPGIHTIEFRDIAGWNKPMRIRAMVRPGRTTFVYQDYFLNRTGTPVTEATVFMLGKDGLCQHYQAPIGFIADEFCGIEEAL